MDDGESLDGWPEDDYPGGWFGTSWGAPICDDGNHLPTPVGEPCTDCKVPIFDGDQGLSVPFIFRRGDGLHAWKLTHIHIDCFRAGQQMTSTQLYVDGER